MNSDFKYEIIKQVATLSDNNGYTKEVNIIVFHIFIVLSMEIKNHYLILESGIETTIKCKKV